MSDTPRTHPYGVVIPMTPVAPRTIKQPEHNPVDIPAPE